AREQHRGAAHPRRLRLFDRVQRRALLPRRAADVHRRRDERDAAHHHRPPADRAEPGLMLPLEGVRVLALEVYGAGPFGSTHLADLGAEVIKIEQRAGGGDVSRAVGPYFLGKDDSHFFQALNRNKKSLSLDLKHPQGREVLYKLVATADGLMSNLRGDQPEKLGVTYRDLQGQSEDRLRPSVCVWP